MGWLHCDCCGSFPCKIDEYHAQKAAERKKRIDKLVLEKLMAHNSSHEEEVLEAQRQLVVGHSEAAVNTVEFRGVQVGDFVISDGTNPTVTKVEAPKEAMRFSDDKLRFDLIPPEALIELARVYSMGALKYEDDNWRKGLPYSSCVRAINSHLTLWRSGQTVDPDTGCHHLAQVAWNALTLLVYDLTKKGKDDRVKFAIDENFDWVDNHLKLGKTKEEKKALRDKYKQDREKHK